MRHLRVILYIASYTLLSCKPHNNISCIYTRLKNGSSRLDWNITGTKKPLIFTGTLKSCISFPNMEGVKITMWFSINWHCCRTHPLMQATPAKATYLSCRLLRASCNGRYFHLLNSLVWTDLSQQS